MYKKWFKHWGWTKYKPRERAVRRVSQVPVPSRPLISPSLRFQAIVITEMGQLLSSILETPDLGWASYDNSRPARSIADVIQGNLLYKRGHVEGFQMIKRGFNRIDVVLRDSAHTLHALLDMLLHLHMYCDQGIIHLLWKHLNDWAKQLPDNGNRIRATLQQFENLSLEKDGVWYRDTVLETQSGVYQVFRQRGIDRDPNVLTIMSNGVAPHLSTSHWRQSDWKSFLISRLNKVRDTTRQAYTKGHAKYHLWLYRHLGNIRNLCGEDSDEAFALATDISTELEGETVKHLRLYPECWISISQYHRRKFEDGGGVSRDHEKSSLDYLQIYTDAIWNLGIRCDAELEKLITLWKWQKRAGYIADAARTEARCSAIISEVAEMATA